MTQTRVTAISDVALGHEHDSPLSVVTRYMVAEATMRIKNRMNRVALRITCGDPRHVARSSARFEAVDGNLRVESCRYLR